MVFFGLRGKICLEVAKGGHSDETLRKDRDSYYRQVLIALLIVNVFLSST